MTANRNLDLLRALAVSTVVVAHCLPSSDVQQAAGHFAVLIFFVHTALVLLLSLERQSTAPNFALRFYTQRIFRIYPLSVLCVLFTLAFRIPWPDAVFTPPSGWSIAANLLLVQNFLHERFSISPPLWSLPFEIQMYAVLPGVYLLVKDRGRRGAAVLALLSVTLPIVEIALSPLRFPSITRYVPCFMGGALAYSARASNRSLSWAFWPAAIGALGILYCAGRQSVVEDWLTCLALGLLIPLFREIPHCGISRMAGLVARYSFGIYLAHVPLLWLCFQRLSGASAAERWILFAALLCIVPVLLYHTIERPLISAGKTLAARIAAKPARSERVQHNPSLLEPGACH